MVRRELTALSVVIWAFGFAEVGPAVCNTHLLAPYGQEMGSIRDLLDTLIAEVPLNPISTYNNLNGYYGHVSCDTKLTMSDCKRCLMFAAGDLFIECRFADGGQIRLDHCQVRFEHYPFPKN
ncbi:hypothetical protein MLD38_039297 [Melastoma candidum]|uniref:Uncharacterized protein n=1 Tax=Melastoma candidum TaxID=119954 RepID=A0ACB9L348_9MYRT|nr:hypothetical protein MLD38_039297 [Melastoma candidum]